MNGTPDAVVVGTGPNSLAAALRLAAAGLRVRVVERAERPGGGARTQALALPGFAHDLCSTVHPMAAASPFFREFDLAAHGVRLRYPEVAFAHPLDVGRAGLALPSLVERGEAVADFFLGSSFRRPPTHGFVAVAWFAVFGLPSARLPARRCFATDEARGLLCGAAAHGTLPLTRAVTGGLGILQTMLAHLTGWPLVEGGSQQLTDAMVRALERQDGEVVPGHEVTDLREFAGTRAVLLDTTPEAFVAMAGDRLPAGYRRCVRRQRHGPGVFTVDWALPGPVPRANPDVHRAGTVHVAGSPEELVEAESAPSQGQIPDRPFVLAVQPTVVDPSRAPAGRHVLGAYTHVPNGSDVDMTTAIEARLERFAPGSRDTILARSTTPAPELAAKNPNLLGGEIANGEPSLRQMLARPVPRWNTYTTPLDGVFLCSAATPPGPAVHGMCGDNAARTVLREVFGIRKKPPLRRPG